MRILGLIFFLFFLATLDACASENDSIDSILNDIGTKTDLSEKTKLENGGVSFIYTRNDIDRMQAKNLKDILKSSYPFGYKENKFGFVDPFSMGSEHPFISSGVRVYIDNQEITTSYFGSGLFILGDMGIDFVDHIEIYTQNPTYEYSTEPTFVLIKLYSKVAQKDRGGKLRASYSSHNSSDFSAYYSDELDEWSYFTFVSYNDDNRDRYSNDKYSKDKETTHLFGSFYSDDSRVLVEAIHQNRDTLFVQNFNLDFSKNSLSSDYLHIGYDTDINNFSFLASYDYYKFHQMYDGESTPLLDMLRIPHEFDMQSKSNVFSLEAKYKYNTKNNKLVTGLKYRYKDYRFLNMSVNYMNMSVDKLTQSYSTAFLENYYSIMDNLIFTSGVNYTNIKTNKGDPHEDLLMYRLGLTYTSDAFVLKTIFSHSMSTLDPIYIGSGFYTAKEDIEPSSADIFMEDIKYSVGSHDLEMILGYMKDKKLLVPNMEGKLHNMKGALYSKSVALRDTFMYRDNDKLFIELLYMNHEAKDLFGKLIIKRAVVRNLNTFGKFDIFNEIIFERESDIDENFYDYSAGVIYHHTDDLSFSFKGENIFNKAKTSQYTFYDPNTFQPTNTLKVPSIDQRFMLSMEYLF